MVVVRNISYRIVVMYFGWIVEVIDSNKFVIDVVYFYIKVLLDLVFFVKRENKIEIESIKGELLSFFDI